MQVRLTLWTIIVPRFADKHDAIGTTVPDARESVYKDTISTYLDMKVSLTLSTYIIIPRYVDKPGFNGNNLPDAGFVPRSQNYFGSTYSNVCKNSTADLELDYRKYSFNENQLKFMRDVQEGKIRIDPEQLPPHLNLSPRPLVPIAENPPKSLHDTEEAEEIDSPYKVSNSDPNKNFMSGKTTVTYEIRIIIIIT
ncbi:protein fam166b-like [Plakobranchus ocellatus]|uniref:Protein fam166b-like n=1 Tax=Plakobranchus ocellatus TaxID=259542 RepID=A0AAV4DR54_9GAST|nr:protein fam166b-like [Plakobranchus ocellatus]